MTTSVPAQIHPALLVWARESAGYTLEAAAQKAHISIEQLQTWEEEGTLSIAQLRKLSNIYKRPLAVFFLPSPPDGTLPIHDFRSLEESPTTLSPNLILEIRRSLQRRSVLQAVLEAMNTPFESSIPKVSLSDDPEQVALTIRSWIGLSYTQQVKWKNPITAFQWWREALENKGILIFQFETIQVSEARGFSISNKLLPIIGVNNKDHYRGRIFSLIHELVHLMLRENGVCLFKESVSADYSKNIEVFCNYVSGATLVPRNYLELEDVVSLHSSEIWTDEDLDKIVKRYQASKETILRRLLICGKTSSYFYNKKREELQLMHEELNKLNQVNQDLESKFTVSMHQKSISRLGKNFIRYIIDGYYNEYITPSTLSETLGIKLKHLNKLEQSLYT